MAVAGMARGRDSRGRFFLIGSPVGPVERRPKDDDEARAPLESARGFGGDELKSEISLWRCWTGLW